MLKKIFLILFGSNLILSGQIFPLEEHKPIYWCHDKLIRYDKGIVEIQNVSKKCKDEKKTRIEIEKQYWNLECVDGKYWANNNFLLTKDKLNCIYSSIDGRNWNREGYFRRTQDNFIQTIHFIRPGMFLLVSFTRFNLNGKYSRFALAKSCENGELVIDRILDMGLEGEYGVPLPTKLGVGPEVTSGMGTSDKYALLQLSPVIVGRTEKFIALTHTLPGYIWLLATSKENPSLELVRIFPGVTEKLLDAGSELEYAVLDVQPTQNGNLLFATRSEEAVILGASGIPKPNCVADFQNQEFRDRLRFRRMMSLRNFPDLKWYELDPESKTFTEKPSPPGIPVKLTQIEDVQKFHFWFDERGNVLSTLSKGQSTK